MNRSPLALIENLAPYAWSGVVHATPISLPLLSFVAVTVASTRNADSALGTGMGTVSEAVATVILQILAHSLTHLATRQNP